MNQLTPWQAEASSLYQRVATGEMSPEGSSLDRSELVTLRARINEGVEWDEQRLPTNVPESDHWAFQPIAALLQDLKQCGMLESTLVVWAGGGSRKRMTTFRRQDEKR